MIHLIQPPDELIRISIAAMLIVLVAMMIDLAAGLHKAYQRGDARRSYGLKRTLSKFILYEGGLIIALGIDLLINYGKFWQLLHVGALVDVPLVVILVAIFLLIVEGWSVHEKADEKSHAELHRTEAAAAKIIDRVGDKLVDAIADRITNHIKPKE